MAVMSLEHMTAVGNSGSAMRRSMAVMPPSMVWLPSTRCSGGAFRPSSAIDLMKASRLALGERCDKGPLMKATLPMTEGGKVLHALANSFGVVHLENVNVGKIGRGIHKHQRKFALHEFLDQLFFDAEGHDGDAIDVALEETAHEAFGAGGVVVCGADEDFIALALRQGFRIPARARERRGW